MQLFSQQGFAEVAQITDLAGRFWAYNASILLACTKLYI
jgi:hypothetical protein